MKYYMMKNTDLEVSALALGTMRIPDKGIDAAEKLIHTALDLGIFVNMIDSEATDRDGGTLNYCMLEDIRIQSWSPLQASGWTGTFIDNPKYAKTNEILADLADKYGVSKTAVALAWILRHPAGMQPILGTTSVEHLTESCDATNFKLTNQEWYDLYLAEGRPLP